MANIKQETKRYKMQIEGISLVKWTELMRILKENAINWRERKLIINMYADQSVKLTD